MLTAMISKTLPEEQRILFEKKLLELSELVNSDNKVLIVQEEPIKLPEQHPYSEKTCLPEDFTLTKEQVAEVVSKIEARRKKRSEAMETKSLIMVSVTVPGSHRYPESTRAYLREYHRHDFKITVNIGVVDQNRQYEFYDVQEGIIEVLNALFVKFDKSTYNFGTRSCEHIANELFLALSEKYSVVHSVSVFEDENNGATVVLDEPLREVSKIRFGHGSVPPGDE